MLFQLGAAAENRLGGRLQDMLRRMLMRPAVISACEPLGDHFRLLTLSGSALRGVGWKPGQKLQVAVGTGLLSTRTYTPIDWDEAGGHTRILVFVRGETPGSAWARDAQVGDRYDVFGPRASLDLSWARGLQRIRQALKRLSVPGPRIVAKAYWAPGKVGLD